LPLTDTVDRRIVEGIEPPPPGTYGAPLMVVRLTLVILASGLLILEFALTVVALVVVTVSVFGIETGQLNPAEGPCTCKPACAKSCPNTSILPPTCAEPETVTFPEFTLMPPSTVRPAFINAPPLFVSVFKLKIGVVKVFDKGARVAPPEVSLPPPMLEMIPLKVAVEMASVEGIVPPPGTYGAPLMVVRLTLVILASGLLIIVFALTVVALVVVTVSVFGIATGQLNDAEGPDTCKPPCAKSCPFTTIVPPTCTEPNTKTFPEFTLMPPVPTLMPPFTVRPAFINAPPLFVSVLKLKIGVVKVFDKGARVVPPKVSLPAPMLERFPLKVAVEMASVEGVPSGAPLIEDTLRLEIVCTAKVAVGCMTGTHCPNIWIDDTLLLMYRGSPTDRTQ
jgi:hypothetical protein